VGRTRNPADAPLQLRQCLQASERCIGRRAGDDDVPQRLVLLATTSTTPPLLRLILLNAHDHEDLDWAGLNLEDLARDGRSQFRSRAPYRINCILLTVNCSFGRVALFIALGVKVKTGRGGVESAIFYVISMGGELFVDLRG
jgi:hypothetical protein